MSNKFDLERFKSGEVAVSQTGSEVRYIGVLPDSRIVLACQFDKTKEWYSAEILLDDLKRGYTMKPKEEWIVIDSAGNAFYQVFDSKEKAATWADEVRGEVNYTLAKIVRQ